MDFNNRTCSKYVEEGLLSARCYLFENESYFDFFF